MSFSGNVVNRVVPKLPNCTIPTIDYDKQRQIYKLRCVYTSGNHKKAVRLNGGSYINEIDAEFEAYFYNEAVNCDGGSSWKTISERNGVLLTDDWIYEGITKKRKVANDMAEELFTPDRKKRVGSPRVSTLNVAQKSELKKLQSISNKDQNLTIAQYSLLKSFCGSEVCCITTTKAARY